MNNGIAKLGTFNRRSIYPSLDTTIYLLHEATDGKVVCLLPRS